MNKCLIVLMVVGAAVGVLALAFMFQIFPMLLKKKLTESAKIMNGTDKWETWRVVPVPVFQKIYIFNVTNPEEVKEGAKPILDELGPYVYQHHRTKVDIAVHDEKDTVSYRHKDEFYFREDMSQGKLTDVITVLNLPFLGAAYKAILTGKVATYMVRTTMEDAGSNEEIYVQITVDEFLFKGYYVPLIEELGALKGETLLPNNTFGLYYGKNGSESLVFEVKSGVNDPESFAKVVSYDNKTTLGVFEDETCDKVQGYDGSVMPPFLTTDSQFELFVPALCHNMKFAYDEDTDFEGIPAFRFTVPKAYLASPKSNPSNACYCSNPGNDEDKTYENCLKGGSWELGPCRGGTPMVMSFPHFYDGPQEYVDGVVGLNPEQDKHELLIVMEPTAAVSLQVAMRVQMNLALTPTKSFTQLKKIPEILHPIFWMDHGMSLPEDKIDMIKTKLLKTQDYVKKGSFLMIGLGFGLVVIALGIHYCRSKNSKGRMSPSHANDAKGSSQNGNVYSDPPVIYNVSEKYSKTVSPPTAIKIGATPEEEPFLQPRAYVARSASPHRPIPVAAPTPPVVSSPSEQSTPTPTLTPVNDASASMHASTPIIIGVYPKMSTGRSREEVDQKKKTDPSSRSMSSLGVPFPHPQQTLSNSNTSVDRGFDFNEIDNTLRGITEALSSYENLK